MILLQSSATGQLPCPFGTFGNSQQHARVIYGWVNRLQPIQVPEGRQKFVFIHLASSMLCHPWLNLLPWHSITASLCKAVQSCASLCKTPPRGGGGVHAHYRLSQARSGEKIKKYFMPLCPAIEPNGGQRHSVHDSLGRPLPAKSRPIQGYAR